LRAIVCRDANQLVRPYYLASFFDTQVFLSNMNSARTGKDCHIGAVIHHERNAVRLQLNRKTFRAL
jgi:hypothetical protein